METFQPHSLVLMANGLDERPPRETLHLPKNSETSQSHGPDLFKRLKAQIKKRKMGVDVRSLENPLRESKFWS